MIFLKFREAVLTSPAKKDRLIWLFLILGLLVNLGLWLVLVFYFRDASEYVVSQFNVYFGISALSDWRWLLLLPGLGLLALAADVILGFYLYLRQQFLSYLLGFTGFLINVILLLAGVLLVFINH